MELAGRNICANEIETLSLSVVSLTFGTTETPLRI